LSQAGCRRMPSSLHDEPLCLREVLLVGLASPAERVQAMLELVEGEPVTGALRLDVSAACDLELRGLGGGAALGAVVPGAVAAGALEQHADGAVPGDQGFDVEQVAGVQ